MSGDELLDSSVGAVLIGQLETGNYGDLKEKMDLQAKALGITNPKLVADIRFMEGVESGYGSKGQPYEITEGEWDAFATDVPQYCGTNVPKIYIVDGDRFSIPI